MKKKGRILNLDLILFVVIIVGVRGESKSSSLFVGGDFRAYKAKQEISGVGIYDDDHWEAIQEGSPRMVGKVNKIISNSSVLYIGGQFCSVGQVSANSIVSYDSISNKWISLCGGVDGEVTAIDIDGSTVYVGGDFATARTCDTGETIPVNNVAKFNVDTGIWSPFLGGIPQGKISSLCVDPLTKVVYVVGEELKTATPFIMAWNGSVWTSLIPNVLKGEEPNEYRAIAVYHPESVQDPFLVVGGHFQSIGGDKLLNIAHFDSPSQKWKPLGAGIPSVYGIQALCFNSQNGELFIGGRFQMAGNVTSISFGNIALWKNQNFFALGKGIAVQAGHHDSHLPQCGVNSRIAHINSLHLLDGESSPLVVGGRFTQAGDVPARNVAIFELNSSSWKSLGNDSLLQDTSMVYAAITSSGDVFAYAQKLSDFSYAQTMGEKVIFARWTKTNSSHHNSSTRVDTVQGHWLNLTPDPMSSFLDVGEITALAINGTRLFIAGSFIACGNIPVHNVAYLEDENWHSLCGDRFLPEGQVHSLLVDGQTLLVGGNFNATAMTLTPGSHDHGSYPSLGIVGWHAPTDTSFSLDGGLPADCAFENSIYSLANDLQHIYCAGSFPDVSIPLSLTTRTVPTVAPTSNSPPSPSTIQNDLFSSSLLNSDNLAVWDKVLMKWSRMGNRSISGSGQYVRSLLVVGGTLYVAGQFVLSPSSDGENVSQNLALYDLENEEWIASPGVKLKNSVAGAVAPGIYCLGTLGSSLLIGGRFDFVEGTPVYNLAVLDDTGWRGLGGGLTSYDNDPAIVWTVTNGDSNDIIFVGGQFDIAGGSTRVSNMARWAGNGQSLEGEWTTMVAFLSRWTGRVFHLIPGFLGPSNLTPSNPYPWWWWYFLGGVAAISFLFISLLAFFGYRHTNRRKHRRQYIPVPPPPDLSRGNINIDPNERLSLKDLANDTDIKRINRDEIKLGERLSLGASGEVIKAIWKGTENVAVKRMALSKNQMTQKFRNDFLLEIKIMSSLSHKNIPKFLGACLTKEAEVFLVMEYCEHGSLRDILAKDPQHNPLDYKLKLRLAVDAAKGIEYLHNCNPPIIHRDLKSSNLLVDKRWRCKVSDFGISRLKPHDGQTITLVGTPAYMAPEVIMKNHYSEKADIFSFGVVLGELMNEEAPYSDLDLFPQQVMYNVVHEGLRPTMSPLCPHSFVVLIQDCLHQDPARRPAFSEIKLRLRRM